MAGNPYDDLLHGKHGLGPAIRLWNKPDYEPSLAELNAIKFSLQNILSKSNLIAGMNDGQLKDLIAYTGHAMNIAASAINSSDRAVADAAKEVLSLAIDVYKTIQKALGNERFEALGGDLGKIPDVGRTGEAEGGPPRRPQEPMRP